MLKANARIKAVDLFCGAGGLTNGLQASGINVTAGYDIEEPCRYAYETNNEAEFIRQDITQLSGKSIESYLNNSDYTLLAGCAPCQPFSTYSRASKKQKSTRDKRWYLLESFSRLVGEIMPDFVAMENVPGLTGQTIFNDFLSSLKEHGYSYEYKIIFCPDYGIPQTRKRLILIASRIGEISIIPATHEPYEYVTVRDAIGHLTPIAAGETDKSDPMHRASILSSINLERIKASKQGGSWLDWPESLRASCHKKATGQTYSSVYGRMSWDKPSPTITTQCNGYGNGRFGHPYQNRAISLREAALLQSFPIHYQFFNPEQKIMSIAKISKMIGNAVPVKLGEVIGQSIKKSLTK